MKVFFLVNNQDFVVRVDNDSRDIFFSSSATNFKEISFVSESLKSGQDEVKVRLTQAIVRDLKSLEDVALYLVSELVPQGLEFVRTDFEGGV